ncbi:diguanylate cyclase [Vibrio sp. 05-20-BW147]|uniref:GGDEF domain-containing protein n=1 Tax=Vibrio sp. 05-20-BW147 TaxID=2575834 RepID=UPI0015947FE9|nr:diguanylate cyclase [Vibrio sp. 05-20-BW147]NVC62688.1 diguanylate cyclase [Vibrio sp. 05-20-BW147]
MRDWLASLHSKRSLTLFLSVSLIFTSSVVFVLYGVYSYSLRSEHMENEIRGQAEESATRLSSTIAGYIESYQIHEYDKLLYTELTTSNHYALLAILVDNYQMTELTGQQSYVTGYVKLPYSEIVEYQPNLLQQQPILDNALYKKSVTIYNQNRESIGRVDVYVTGELLLLEKRHLLLNIVATIFLLVVLQTCLSLFGIKWILIRPLNQLSHSLTQRDCDGLPLNKLKVSPYSELKVLTQTVNGMLEVISATRDKLHVEHERLENVIRGTNAGTWYWNVETGETRFNGRWAEIIGYTLEEISPVSIETWLKYVHPSDLRMSQRRLTDYFAGKTDMYECEVRMKHKDGHWVWVMDRGRVAQWNEDGKPLEMFGTHVDISESKARERQLELAANVFKYVHEGIVITDSKGSIVDVNQAFTYISGYEKSELQGQTLKLLKSGMHDEDFYHDLWELLLSRGYWRGEIWNRRKNGEVRPDLLTISKVEDRREDEVRFVALFSDISALKEHESQLEKIAHYDPLTELPNRLLLKERLLNAMERSRRYKHHLAVLFLDLDGFKQVNDTYGHDAGDDVLYHVAARMKDMVREGDTLARLGGDEFIILMPDVRDSYDVEPIAQRFLQSVCRPISIGRDQISLSASIGVSMYFGEENLDSDALIRRADQAMYQAKLAGKNCYMFYSGENPIQQFSRTDK